MSEIRENEYIDPADGLIHCRKCGGLRQAVIPDPFKGGTFKPRCVCPCQQEKEQHRKEAEERRQRMDRIRRRKAQGLQDRYLYGYTFANDNGQNPVMAKAHACVAHWKVAFKRNIGLLLFGDVGTGKSFLAGTFGEARTEFLDSLGDYDLLIIDDLGVERNTEYALEQMFSIIDSRYRSGKPLIVTTNLKLDELKDPPDLARARIYDHILERCAPILFAGKNFREDNAASTKAAARQIITYPKPIPDTPPALVKKIGKITYRVWAHFSETSTETMEDKIKRMLREEVRQMMENE